VKRNSAITCAALLLVAASSAAAAPLALTARDANTSATPPKATAKQLERASAKLRMATAIVAGMEPAAKANGLRDGWQLSVMTELMRLSNETLAGMRGVTTPSALPDAVALAKRVAPKALGDADDDLVFVPTPGGPCRYIDTRPSFGGAGKINGTRSYDLDLNVYLVHTSPPKCSSNPYALFGATLAALTLNMAIVDPSLAPGVASIVPLGTASPDIALINWYEAGPSVQASNSAIVPIDQVGGANEIDIFTSAPVHVIVDIFGAFRASEATALECTNATVGVSVPAGGTNFGTATCPAGYTATGGGFDGSLAGATGTVSPDSHPSGNGWIASFYNPSGGTANVTVYARCCRVPGR
jgi:hypothetical protein